MNETRKMNFKIEDAITEAYEQMNEAHCGTDRKNEASYTKNTKDSQLKWGREYILNTDANNSVTPMLTQMKNAMKRASMRHPKLGAGTEVKTKKGSILIVPETAELYLKSRDRLPTPLQKNMDKMAERSIDGLFTVLQAALNDLRTGMIESMTEVLENINEAKMNYVIYDKKTKEVYASSSKPFDKFKMDDVADDMKVKKSDLVMKKMRKNQKAGERLKEASETITEVKFSKDFDKEAKEKGPHQDSSVYKQMRDIIKTQGFANVKTDKGSLKVDMQSAYAWLVSYHMLSDKNKETLIKMAQKSKDSLATTIRVAHKLTVRR
tara:strand:+ start:98146 stop:99111 length:966 start_codon:yes stop_codon:yes gene_type:complete